MAYLLNYYSQQDPAWKNKKLGFSNVSIGTDGCAITSLAMLVKGFGYDETPATLNKKLKDLGENNGYIGALVIWGSIPILFPKISYKNLVLCRDHNAPLAQIDDSLANGQPVLVEVDRSLSSGLQMHWVVLYGKKGNDYLMTDPWNYPSDDDETLLSARYGFGRLPQKFITAVLWYEMQGIAPPPPTDGFYVQVFAPSGLSLRAQPTTASTFLALEKTSSYLRVLEDETSARQKIGVMNQWVLVRDSRGVEGYVAAWYVGAVGENIPDPELDPDSDPDTDPIPDPDLDPNAETLSVYVDPRVGASGLRMRATPSKGGRTVTTLRAGAKLTCLENADSVHAKIDVLDKWLHVKDGAEHKGYVAAWYVLDSLDESEVPDPEPTSLQVIVFPSLGTDGLRMRSLPSIDGSLITVLRGGTKLSLLEDEAQVRAKIGVFNQWLHVRAPSGEEGYVAAWYVLADEGEITPDTDSLPESLTVRVIPLARHGLRMRKGASTAYPIIRVLMPNSRLTVLEAAEVAIAKIGAVGEWLRVRDAQGTEGYVAAWYVIR